MPTLDRDAHQPWRGQFRYRSLYAGSMREFEDSGVSRPVACGCGSQAPSAAQCRRMVVDSVPVLASHAGKGGPDLVLSWNDLGARPDAVDIVVHMHGHAKCRDQQNPKRLDLCRDILPICGLDFTDPDGTNHGNGRQRPTLALLPRGNYTGTDGGTGYDFQNLAAPGGLQKLIAFALAQLQSSLGTSRPRMQRLILTAHSGGGDSLQRILGQVDADEVHIFDALYSLPDTKHGSMLGDWMAKRIARDLAAIRAGQSPASYMAAQGGALRVISLTTPTISGSIGKSLASLIPAGSPLAKYYRVEYTCEDHCTIPRRFGWQLLADASANLVGLAAAQTSCGRPRKSKPTSELQFDSSPSHPSLRDSIVAVAEREWQNWSLGTLAETSQHAAPLLKEYYRVGVGQSVTTAQVQSKSWHADNAWSAVFVSYVMREAGAGDSFGYSAAHTGYVAAAKRAAANRDAAKFQAFPIDRAAIDVGDVVCRDRVNKAGQCFGTSFKNAESGGHSHGEIVLEVNPQAGYAITIGGNTSQDYPKAGLKGDTVGKHKILIDSRGMVATQGRCPYFAVLKVPTQTGPQSETGLEYDSATVALPSLASASRDFSLQEIAAAGLGILPKEFREAILVHGETDATNLTNRVFWHVNHPELNGKTPDPRDPKQAKLRTEWNRILNTQVGPLIWLRQVIDQLDRHRGTIPREFLLGWMTVESDGRVSSSATQGEELGYFQIMRRGGEAKQQLGLSDADFERLKTDRLFSIREGVALADIYRKHFLNQIPSIADGSDLLLRLMKGRHAVPTDLDKALKTLTNAGKAITWGALSPLLLSKLRNNVNTTMEFAAKLKPLAELVPVSGAQPELESTRWDGAAAQPYRYEAETPFLAWRRHRIDRQEANIPTQPVPVLQLTQIQGGPYTSPFTRGPSGFDALFCGELASPQLRIVITGKLMAEENGLPRTITPADRQSWQPKDAINQVHTGRGVSIAESPAKNPVAADGSFQTESRLILDPGTRRIHIRVSVDLKSGPVTAEAIFERRDFDCFLEFVDGYEKKRPIGHVDGKCQVAAGHLEFLSTVRKMFQPKPGSSFAAGFDMFLHRNRKMCQLADLNSAQGKYIRTFEDLEIAGDKVDIGHVLVGIEASRRQKPDATFPTIFSSRDAATEAYMTWAGDLGSALYAYAEAISVKNQRANLQDYLTRMASANDLLGDIDGINLGAIYDETKSLSENLRSYYNARPFRRFHNFLSSATDDSGQTLFGLAGPNQPVLSASSRLAITSYVVGFAGAELMKKKMDGKLTDAQFNQITPIVAESGSQGVTAAVEYFAAFLQAGLAKEK